jgi:hypothetical protein
MQHLTAEQQQAARRPIDSLISKSEKAQRKLAEGTWQHARLRDNLHALHLASALMRRAGVEAHAFTLDDLHAALRVLAAMLDTTDKARSKFAPGTSQHSLLRNRFDALQVAEAVIRAELGTHVDG